MVTSSNQIPHDFLKAAPGSDWLVYHSSMARTKMTPRKGEQGKARKIKARAEVHVVPTESPAPTEPPVPAEPPLPTEEAPPTLGEVERR